MEPEKGISSDLAQKNIDIISFFDKNDDFVFVYKKTEKLASAVYMVTNLFSENEPIKWTLRKKVSDLLSFTVTYKDVSKSNLEDFVYNLKTRILELVSLLEIALRGSLLSQMNFSILKQEFYNLIDAFTSHNLAHKDLLQETISRTFFNISPGTTGKEVGDSGIENSGQSFISSHKMAQFDIKDKNLIKDKSGFKRSNRQNIILNIIKKKKELTIKDISQVIKDCSEKTIQRELISFISAGVLKRTGERRWSRYSLA